MIKIIDIYVQRSPLAFVFLVDRDSPDTLLALYVSLHDFFCQRLTYNATVRFSFTAATNLSYCSRAVCNLRSLKGRKHSLC